VLSAIACRLPTLLPIVTPSATMTPTSPTHSMTLVPCDCVRGALTKIP
jgi:hypothetical protein